MQFSLRTLFLVVASVALGPMATLLLLRRGMLRDSGTLLIAAILIQSALAVGVTYARRRHLQADAETTGVLPVTLTNAVFSQLLFVPLIFMNGIGDAFVGLAALVWMLFGFPTAYATGKVIREMGLVDEPST